MSYIGSSNLKESDRMSFSMDNPLIRLIASPDRCGLCRGRDDLLFCTPCFGFKLCGHTFCQSSFRFKNRTKEPKSFTCPVCVCPFYYSLSSLDEAVMIGEAAYYNLCSFRCEKGPTKQINEINTFRTKQRNICEQFSTLYPESICSLVYSICYLNSLIATEEFIKPQLVTTHSNANKGALLRQQRLDLYADIYKLCIRSLDMTNHESAF